MVQPLRAAGVVVLLTSRADLPEVPREARMKLDVLPLPEALDLFASYYGRGAALDLTADELRDVTTIVTLLGRHTLAVKLQAANAATLGRPLSSIAAELEANPKRALLLEDGTEAVGYVLDSSYAAIEAPAQRVLSALGAFATADVGRQAALFMGMLVAQELDSDDEISDDEAEAVAERSLKALITLRLADHGLDEAMPEDSDRERLRLHPLVYAYAQQQFGRLTPAAREALSRAVAQWYADYSNAIEDTALEPDERNILGALDWALARGANDLLMRLAIGVAHYWATHSLTAARERHLPPAVAAAERKVEDDRTETTVRRTAALHFHYATLLQQLGRMDESKAMSAASLEEYHAIGDQGGEGIALAQLGDLALQEGDLANAKADYSRYLAIMQAVHDQREEGVAWFTLAGLHEAEGDLDEAERCHRESLAIAFRLRLAPEILPSLEALGDVPAGTSAQSQ